MTPAQITFLFIFSVGLALLVFMFLKTSKAEKVISKEEMKKLQNKFNQ